MYITETVAPKPIKRVRFSDEVQNVYEFDECEENEEAVSVENESNAITVNHSQELRQSFSEKLTDSETTLENIRDDTSCVSDSSVNMDSEFFTPAISNPKIDDSDSLAATSENKISIADHSVSRHLDDVTINTYLMTIYDQSRDSCIDMGSESKANLVSHGLNEVIDKKLMPITRTEVDQPTGVPSLVEESFCSSFCKSVENVEKDEDLALHSLQSNLKYVPGSHKRCLEEMQIEKQSTKLNTYLKKHCSDVKSACEIKSAMFTAWNEVKKEQLRSKGAASVPDVKKALHLSSQILNAGQKSPLDTRRVSRRPKPEAKKTNVHSSKPEYKLVPIPQKTKEDLEESKMAFQAWKKKKDEVLKYQIAEKYRKEEKERLDSLMKERIRKQEAETAYSTWNSHKANMINMEKRKAEWFLGKEKEKVEEKLKRDDEALKAYDDWLMSKVYEKKTHEVLEDKLPWSPPGR